MFSQVTKPETAYIRDLHSRTRNLTAAQESQARHSQNIKRLDRYERSSQRTLYSRSSPEEFNVGDLHRNYQPESRTLESRPRKVTNTETTTTRVSDKQTSIRGLEAPAPVTQGLFAAHSVTTGASDIARTALTPVRTNQPSTPQEYIPDELPAPPGVQSSSAANAKAASEDIAGIQTAIGVGTGILAAI
jgi:hypothetical protein